MFILIVGILLVSLVGAKQYNDKDGLAGVNLEVPFIVEDDISYLPVTLGESGFTAMLRNLIMGSEIKYENHFPVLFSFFFTTTFILFSVFFPMNLLEKAKSDVTSMCWLH